MKDLLDDYVREHQQEETATYLDRLSREGVRIFVEGYPVPPALMARMISVSEGFCYMPDFVDNDRGKLVEVRFNRVSLN